MEPKGFPESPGPIVDRQERIAKIEQNIEQEAERWELSPRHVHPDSQSCADCIYMLAYAEGLRRVPALLGQGSLEQEVQVWGNAASELRSPYVRGYAHGLRHARELLWREE
jgi:hypothetical protein